MNKKTNLLITGASGSIGIRILKALYLSEAYHITVFDLYSKQTAQKLQKFKNHSHIIYRNITNPNDIEKISKNQDVVIHLAAIIPTIMDDQPNLMYQVNTIGTELLVQALQRNSPDVFFIFSSSISVYGDRLNNPNIKVTDPLNPIHGDHYAQTKIQAENFIQKVNYTGPFSD